MKKLLSSVALIGLASAASAGGLDRSGQSVGFVFEDGRVAQLSYGSISPDVTGAGNPLIPAFAASTMGPAEDYNQIGMAVKWDVNEQLSFAVIYDQPFGADINYGLTSAPAYHNGTVGTTAQVESSAISGVLNYQVSERFSVHGGLRYQTAEGFIQLAGGAFGSLSGYSLNLEKAAGLGFMAGAAYEIPDIALRVALTYNSEVDHDLAYSEAAAFGGGTGTTTVTTPESLNLEFQTGIAKDTLLFGSVRYAKWGDFDVIAPTPTAISMAGGGGPVDLANLGNSTSYSLGVGRRLNDNWAVSAVFGYEGSGSGTVSPLAPSNGSKSLGLAAVYTMDDVSITGGVRYVKVGDAVTDNNVAVFEDNSALAIGVSVKFGF